MLTSKTPNDVLGGECRLLVDHHLDPFG
jgi:hypothetical protein